MTLAGALTTAILPVLAIAAAGAVLGTVRDVSVDALATISLYVLTPALVFYSLSTTPLSGAAVIGVAVGVTLFTVVMIGLALAVAHVLDADVGLRNAVALTSAFPNSGNYGIPLATFAFGAIGASTAVLFLAAQSVLVYTLGVVLASRGAGTNLRRAATQVFRLPLLYAAAAAGLARGLDMVPTGSVMDTIQLTGEAAIPVMLLLLGVQLVQTRHGRAVTGIAPAVLLKLLVAPVVGALIALAVGFTDATVGRVFILETAMPAAITPLMLAVEFGGDEEGLSTAGYVSSAILVTTLASMLTLTILVTLLQSGTIL
ncbi:MAG: AEC family transporter [Halobacteriaceae archaeon]